MPLPNFLILGAAKAGTTSLYQYCRQHPSIFVPELKEPRFFALEGKEIEPQDPVNQNTITQLDDYQKLFAEVTTETAIGEASPAYFPDPGAPARVAKYLESPKLIVILRNPIDRAYSHFLFAVQKGFEPPDATFLDAIHKPTVVVGDWVRERPYVDSGMYHLHLTRWLEEFDEEQINVCFFEDLVANPGQFARDIYAFLGVDATFQPTTDVKFAKSGVPQNRRLHQMLAHPSKLKKTIKQSLPKGVVVQLRKTLGPLRTRLANRNLVKPEMPPEARVVLSDMYRDDIEQLEELLRRDLSSWYAEPSTR